MKLVSAACFLAILGFFSVGSSAMLAAELTEKAGLVVSIVPAPPRGENVILSQPFGCKGPTSIRYFPLEERELKTSHNPTDPNGARYFKRDRDLGQTFTVPAGGPFQLDAVTTRIGPVSSGSIDGAIGAKVSLQIMAVEGEPRIVDNGTTTKGMTVSKGYRHRGHRQ